MSVTVTTEGPVVTLTLDRPEKLNALDESVRLGLADALTALEDDPDTRVVVLEGAGRAFSAGADLGGGAYADLDVDWATRRHRTGNWQRLLDQFGRIPQATVARLHSHVIGGAALLAAACDIRVASDDTVVKIPELAIGIPLTWAGVPLLVREIGLPLTRDWVMTGRSVAADELLRSGFAQRVVAREELDGAVAQCVAELTDMPAGPLAMTRALTAAIGRTTPAMVAGWADPDALQWSFREPEGRSAAADYDQRRRS
ncbi:enoyl-CoA hydratase/isomerase family protein [Actinospongicola halichondriae]|uniref:enoyl-CoA hydratase/isomerase family protein n=1 Tax=Actinospongicola halichondriae TaxID=3236844 RepID=UPI003D445E32